MPTHHRHLFPSADPFVMTDVEDGEDVDVVSDAHYLHDARSAIGGQFYNAVLACSVWEHLKRPWIAADSVHNVLSPGGIFFIQTHFVFPEHGYPSDYFRFTTEGLKSLFSWADDVECAYDFGCMITPPSGVVWNPDAPAFLNVCITGRRP